MTVRSRRLSMCVAVTALMLLMGGGVARAQEGPIDHLRHRTRQIAYATHRVLRHHRPVVVRVYASPDHRHHYRYLVWDRRHHRYYYRTYRRY
jgi:hypothetical protein